MYRICGEFVPNESGATAIEYGLLAALISLVCVAAMTAVGTQLFGFAQDLAAVFANLT